jgi:hypothetical protein
MKNSLLYLSQNFTQEDVDNTVKFIETIDDKSATIRKISFLTVELLQNIVHHSDKNKKGETFAYYELIKDGENYVIKTGNLITKENSEGLEKRMDCVLSSTDEEIKEKILNRLQNEDFNEKGGAGIGLLSIKKRVSQGMSYNIEVFEGEYNFIHFEIKIL